MKHFYQTTALAIYKEFDTCIRDLPSLITVFYLIQYFNCKKILEVGFYQGQTFGAMLEAAAAGSQLTTIDPVLRTNIYNKYYHNSNHTKDKHVDLLEIKFEDFKSTETYDFILVDSGMPSDEWINTPTSLDDAVKLDVDRSDHLIRSLQYATNNTIIALDDYRRLPAEVDRFLSSQTEFVPFLMDGTTLYFHKSAHNASDFLDNFLESKISNSCSLYNIEYRNYIIKNVELNQYIDLYDFKDLWLDIFKIKNI